MRIVALVMVVSGVALADLIPEKASCGAPQTCRACELVPRADGGGNEEAEAGCFANAEDAGLESFPCVQLSDAGTHTYFYCPPDTDSPSKQGCSSVLLGAPLALLAVFGAWRTRKRA